MFTRSICFAGDYIAVGFDDGRIELYQTQFCNNKTLSPVIELLGHVGSVNSMAYVPNYDLLVSGSSDRTLKG